MKIGTNKTFLIAAIIIACAALALILKITTGTLDKTGALDSVMAPVLSQFNISKKAIVSESRKVLPRGRGRYISVSREYEIAAIDFKKFTNALEEKLNRSPFQLTKYDYVLTKVVKEAHYAVGFKRLEILSLTLRQRQKAARPAAVKVKAFANPTVAIVIDDFGNGLANLDTVFDIRLPVTFSILPNLKYSTIISNEARARGYDVILHLPLEPNRNNVKQEPNTVKSSMPEAQVLGIVRADIESVPGAVGVSNHMGSKATADIRLMETVFSELKQNNLFFLDSFVTDGSVCEEAAKRRGIRYARRNVFLDNELEEGYVRAQLTALEDYAFKAGSAIAIGHDRKVTVKVLREAMPEMERQGIRFVKLRELVGDPGRGRKAK